MNCINFGGEACKTTKVFHVKQAFLTSKDQITGGTVRVRGGMSLRNGMWHGLRSDIIKRNVIYAE